MFAVVDENRGMDNMEIRLNGESSIGKLEEMLLSVV